MHMYMYEGKTIQAHFYVEPSLKLINSTNEKTHVELQTV